MSRSRIRRWTLICVAGVLASAAVAGHAQDAARDPPPGTIRDLDYGDVLFHFFQDDYFDALVRLEVSRDLNRIEHHAAEAELLRFLAKALRLPPATTQPIVLVLGQKYAS